MYGACEFEVVGPLLVVVVVVVVLLQQSGWLWLWLSTETPLSTNSLVAGTSQTQELKDRNSKFPKPGRTSMYRCLKDEHLGIYKQ